MYQDLQIHIKPLHFQKFQYDILIFNHEFSFFFICIVLSLEEFILIIVYFLLLL